MKNLWPDFGITNDEITPKEILIAQGESLSKSTGNILAADISTEVVEMYEEDYLEPDIPEYPKYSKDISDNHNTEYFFHIFSIKAWKLKYSFNLLRVTHSTNLLRVTHSTLEVYPCFVKSPIANEEGRANNPKELEDLLSVIFSNEKVRKAIESVLIQSKT